MKQKHLVKGLALTILFLWVSCAACTCLAGFPQNRKGKPMNQNHVVKEVGLEQLEVQYHPRKGLGKIDLLINSIKRDGLQDPLLVHEVGEGRFAIIDGLRRYQAVQALDWKTVPCTVREAMKPDEAAHLSYVKNAERDGFTPIEIALHIKAMKETFGYSLRELEIKGYGTPPSIAGKLKLLELAEPVQAKIGEGKLTVAHGVHLLKMPNHEEQSRMAKRIVGQKLTAKQADRQIERLLAKEKEPKPKTDVVAPESGIPGVYLKDARDMSELPDKSVHLVVTGPPHLGIKEHGWDLSTAEYWDNIKAVMNECARVMAPDGIIAMVVRDILNFTDGKRGGYYPYTLLAGPKYQAMLKQHGLRLTDTIVWVQSPLELAPEDASWGYSHKSSHTAYRISCNHQLIYIFRYAGVREAPPADAAARSRLTKAEWADWTKGVWHIERASHHLILPEELVRRLVKMYSYEGDTVLDPFLGSGTVVKIARELGRKAFGYEREPGCDSAIMKTLGIEAPASAKGMVAYAKDVFAADGHPAGAENAPKPVPESFTSLSPKVLSDLLLKGDSKAEADEENPEAAA